MEERELLKQKRRNLISMLSSTTSEYGDWKNMKQLDTGCYTEEEMEAYRAGRAEIRNRIAEIDEILSQGEETEA